MSLEKLVEDVTRWHRQTYGDGVYHALAGKLREEARELAVELYSWQAPSAEIADELADVQILLCAIAGRMGYDLVEEARRKFAIVSSPERNQKQRDIDRGILEASK